MADPGRIEGAVGRVRNREGVDSWPFDPRVGVDIDDCAWSRAWPMSGPRQAVLYGLCRSVREGRKAHRRTEGTRGQRSADVIRRRFSTASCSCGSWNAKDGSTSADERTIFARLVRRRRLPQKIVLQREAPPVVLRGPLGSKGQTAKPGLTDACRIGGEKGSGTFSHGPSGARADKRCLTPFGLLFRRGVVRGSRPWTTGERPAGRGIRGHPRQRALQRTVLSLQLTLEEPGPLDVEAAVNPEMLGRVFEELMTGAPRPGAYYTPRTVVSFMCREALKGYLSNRTSAYRRDRRPVGRSAGRGKAEADARPRDSRRPGQPEGGRSGLWLRAPLLGSAPGDDDPLPAAGWPEKGVGEKGSGTFVRSTRRAVPEKVPTPFSASRPARRSF